MVKINLLFGMLLLMTSCVTDVELEQASGSNIVLNGLIVPGEPIAIYLYRSRLGNNSLAYESIDDADVELMVNGDNIDNLNFEGKGCYTSATIARELTTYKIAVNTRKGEKVWAETITPEIDFASTIFSNWELDSTQRYYWPYFITIVDNPSLNNNYWVGDLTYYMGNDSIYKRNMANTLKTSSLLADRFNITYDPDNQSYPYQYDYYIHFSDNDFQGDTLKFDLITPRINTQHDSIIIYNVDIHYSSYLKSKLIGDQSPDYLTDDGPPINYKPAFIYSNVHGGMGILGSYTAYSKAYNYD